MSKDCINCEACYHTEYSQLCTFKYDTLRGKAAETCSRFMSRRLPQPEPSVSRERLTDTAEQIFSHAEDWHEGRKPFSTEAVANTIARNLKEAGINVANK